jgi:hypothetical protein
MFFTSNAEMLSILNSFHFNLLSNVSFNILKSSLDNCTFFKLVKSLIFWQIYFGFFFSFIALLKKLFLLFLILVYFIS